MAAMELNNTILKNNTNLKAYYRFESGAETTDSSGTGNTLSNVGTPTYSAGQFGQSVNLASASSQGFTITDGATVKPTGNFTVGAWFKTSTAATQQSIFQSWSNISSKLAGIILDVSTNSKLRLLSGKNTGAVQNTDFVLIESAVTVTDGLWHLGVFTWDGATVRLYLDAKHSNSQAWANAPAYNATNYVRVGINRDNAAEINYFNGSLDDVFLLNGTALSADQIKELYEGRYVGEGWPQAGLVAGYHLSNETDFSGNNYHLTNNNAVTFTAGKLNLAANFGTSNTNKYLRITSDLGITGGNITMIGWVKMLTEIPSASGAFFSQGDAGTNTYYNILYEYNGGTRRLLFRRVKVGVAANDVTYNIALGTTSWYQLCLVYDGSNVTAYINGSQVSTPTASTGSGSSGGADSFSIGNHSSIGTGPEAYISALIDEVQVYNVAKDARWVRQQYALGMGRLI